MARIEGGDGGRRRRRGRGRQRDRDEPRGDDGDDSGAEPQASDGAGGAQGARQQGGGDAGGSFSDEPVEHVDEMPEEGSPEAKQRGRLRKLGEETDIDTTDVQRVDRRTISDIEGVNPSDVEGAESADAEVLVPVLSPRARVTRQTGLESGEIRRLERTEDGVRPVLTDEVREERASEQALRQLRSSQRPHGTGLDPGRAQGSLGREVSRGDLDIELTGQRGASVQLEEDFVRDIQPDDRFSQRRPREGIVPGFGSDTPEEAVTVEEGGTNPDFGRALDAGHLTSNPSPGAQFFGTAEREQAVEREAMEGSRSAQLFVGGEALGEFGAQASGHAENILPDPDWLDESVKAPVFVPGSATFGEVEVNPALSLPTFTGVGDVVGVPFPQFESQGEGVRVGEQLRNVAVGAPTGVGLLTGLPPKALGDVGLRAESALGRDIEPGATPTAAATTTALTVAGGKVGQGIQEEPVGAAVEIAAPFAVGKVSPVRVRQFDVPEKAPEGASTSVSTVRQAGAATELVRRGESPTRLGELDLDPVTATPTTRVTGVRLEKPEVMQAVGTRSRGRTLFGFEGNRPRLGSPATDPNRIDLGQLGSRPGGTVEPNNPFETDVLQATARRQGGEVARRAGAVEGLIREASGEGIPGTGVVRRQAALTRQTVGREIDSIFNPLDEAAFGAGERFGQRLGALDDAAFDVGETFGQAIARGESAVDTRLSPLDEAAFSAGARTGQALSTGGEVFGNALARGGQLANQPFRLADDFGFRAGQQAGRRVRGIEDRAFGAGERFGQRLGALDDAAFGTWQRVGQRIGEAEDVFGEAFGQLDDSAFTAGERVGQRVGQMESALDPLGQPLESAAFDAGETFGVAIGDLEARFRRGGDSLSAEEIVGNVRAVPEDRTGAIVEALQETEATIFGSAAAKAQVSEFRQPRDLDVIVPDAEQAQQRFTQALEGANAQVSDVFDIKEIADAPGRARGGEPIKFGRVSQEKLTTEEGIQVNPVQEELVRKAGASGFFREPGAAGTREFDVGPEPRRPSRTDVREKDPQDASTLAGQLLGEDNPAVREFNEAFGTRESLIDTDRGGLFGDFDFGLRDFAGDQRGQATFGGFAREDATTGVAFEAGRAMDTGTPGENIFGANTQGFDATPSSSRPASPSPGVGARGGGGGASFRALPAVDSSTGPRPRENIGGGASPFGGFFGGGAESPGAFGRSPGDDGSRGGIPGLTSPPGGQDDGGNIFFGPPGGGPSPGDDSTPPGGGLPGIPGSPPGGPGDDDDDPRRLLPPFGGAGDQGGFQMFDQGRAGEEFTNPIASGAAFLGIDQISEGSLQGDFDPFSF